MKTHKEILSKITCNNMREITEERALQAMQEVAIQEEKEYSKAEYAYRITFFCCIGFIILVMIVTCLQTKHYREINRVQNTIIDKFIILKERQEQKERALKRLLNFIEAVKNGEGQKIIDGDKKERVERKLILNSTKEFIFTLSKRG